MHFFPSDRILLRPGQLRRPPGLRRSSQPHPRHLPDRDLARVFGRGGSHVRERPANVLELDSEQVRHDGRESQDDHREDGSLQDWEV